MLCDQYPDCDHFSDHEWIRLLKKQDPDAVAALWCVFYRRAIAYARRRNIDEDLARDAAEAAFKRTMQKGINQYSFQSSFCGYIYRILVNEINRRFKKLLNEPFDVDIDESPSNALGETDPPPQRDTSKVWKILEECLEELPERERAILEMYFFDGLSYQEIADRLDITKVHAHVLAHRARKKVKDCLERKGFYSADELLNL